jgi:hypothetical protein
LGNRGSYPLRARSLLAFPACLLSITLAAALGSRDIRTDAPAPFSIGEKLVYTIKWDPPWYLFFLPTMEAGEIEVQLAGETEYNNRKALKILFRAHSSGTLVTLTGMNVEDEFVFFTEPDTFCTLAASKKIRESKRKRQINVEYLRETRQLHFREMDESVVPPQLKRDETKNEVPVCVQDPLSSLYFYRMSQLAEGHAQTFVIGDNDKIKEVVSRVQTRERIKTPAGEFTAWRIRTSALMGGLFKEGGQFTLWLSADERKLPLQFEIRVKLGKVIGKLKACTEVQ